MKSRVGQPCEQGRASSVPGRVPAEENRPIGRRGVVLSQLSRALTDESPRPQRRTIALAGGVLSGFGATLVLTGMLVERSPKTQFALALSAIGVAYAVTLLLLSMPDALPVSVFPYITAMGTLLITVIAYADGSARNAYVLLYVWAAFYAFYFFRPRVALLEILWISVAVAVELVLRGWPSSSFSVWLMITGTCLIGGLVIRELVTEMRRLAHRDALTGLYNRGSLEEHIEREQRRAARTGEPLSLAMLDLDGFKQLNDARGHQEGDRCLAAVARAWEAELRRSDIIVRFGGDEFVVVMPSCSLERARVVADRLRALTPDGLTASAGVTEWTSTQDVQALIACVDAALYSAKGAGRDRTVVVTSEFDRLQQSPVAQSPPVRSRHLDSSSGSMSASVLP